MSSFCPHCGASLAAANQPGGPPADCPACGRSLSQSRAGVSTVPIANRLSAITSRLPRFRKDAIIGLAILVVLLSLGRLLTHPERLGTLGPSLKTNLFGAYGVGLAETLGQGTGRSAQLTPGTNSSVSSVDEPVPESTNSAFRLVSQPRTNAGPSNPDESLLATNSVEVIGGLPTELSDVPAISSPEAAAMARRLDEAGARTGDIQLSLSWNDYNDLDLHCFDPQGEQIWYSNKRSAKTGGILDVDRNASEPFVAAPVENIYWPAGGAPSGIYRVCVVYYAQHPSSSPYPTAYIVRVVVEDKTNYFSGRIGYTGRKEPSWVCSFQYDPNNPDRTKHRRFLSNR
jgi:hypothetical protein